MTESYRVLIAEPLSPRAQEILTSAAGFEVLNQPGIGREELIASMKSVDALIVRSATQVDEEVLKAGEQLKVVARAVIGVDNIDLESASRQGILVINAPDGNVITTAEHTIALIFSLARKIPAAVTSVKSGKWERSRFVGGEIFSKILGVVGLGRIGSTVARLAKDIGMSVIAYDPFISAEAASSRGVKLVSFDELLAQSDYITLHVPVTAETRHLIGREEIEKMKEGVRLINCARGGLLDEAAVAEAMDEGKIAGVALDVYEVEPPGKESPLVFRDEVVCTPHLGASTEEAQENVATSVARQIVDYLSEGIVTHAVNLPSLTPEELERLGPYIDLAERLGSFLAQLASGGVQRLQVIYGGPLENPMGPLTAAALKGVMSHFLSGARVNLVNALLLAKERGIEVDTTKRSEMPVYTDLIEIKVWTGEGERSVAGTFVRTGEPRIVLIDDLAVDAVPEGFMLVFKNDDQPGMIGTIGTLLGNHKVNIAGMQLGRQKKKGRAVAILNLDDPIPDDVLDELRSVPNIYDVKLVRVQKNDGNN
ncbi:MAG: phosphoglycerate dehydrogenase [bacterium]|nr:phosphoglycerate dehydrogenase [bacterium]